MRRYFIEWDSIEALAALEHEAQRTGTWSDEHDDWWDPIDVLESREGTDDLASTAVRARDYLHDALYGQVRVYERRGLSRQGSFWDYGEAVLVAEISDAS